MRQTLLGAVLSWIAVAVLVFATSGWVWPVAGAIGLASSFSFLWLLHVAVFAQRRVRAAAEYRRSAGLDMSRRAFFGTGGKAVAAAVVVSIPAACAPLPDIVWCECYFDSDCGFRFFCRYDVDCSHVPKGTEDDDEHGRPECAGDSSAGSCDGLCKFLRLPYRAVSREVVANVADLYFQAYVRAAEGATRNGEPDRAILAQARAVELPDDGHKALTGAVFSTLDLTAGWDFIVGLRDMSDPERPGVDGFFRGVPEGQVEIVEAVRTGFVETIRSGQPQAILPPIQAFWSAFPDFQPNHGGRCYPHGHLEYETALQCHEANLMKIATALVAED